MTSYELNCKERALNQDHCKRMHKGTIRDRFHRGEPLFPFVEHWNYSIHLEIVYVIFTAGILAMWIKLMKRFKMCCQKIML